MVVSQSVVMTVPVVTAVVATAVTTSVMTPPPARALMTRTASQSGMALVFATEPSRRKRR